MHGHRIVSAALLYCDGPLEQEGPSGSVGPLGEAGAGKAALGSEGEELSLSAIRPQPQPFATYF